MTFAGGSDVPVGLAPNPSLPPSWGSGLTEGNWRRTHAGLGEGAGVCVAEGKKKWRRREEGEGGQVNSPPFLASLKQRSLLKPSSWKKVPLASFLPATVSSSSSSVYCTGEGTGERQDWYKSQGQEEA